MARVDNTPLESSFKGSFAIPGTDTRLRLSGFARVDFVHDFRPIGSTDDFIVSTIPIDSVSGADNSTIHARETRLGLELRRPSPFGQLRVLFENDFFGSGGERAVNLRHAYGQVANLLGGFTVSTLQDVDARPDTLDYEGPPGRVTARHAQIRYTRRLPAGQSVAMAAEEPKPNLPSTTGDETITVRTPWPDVVVRYRIESKRSHFQIGGVARSLGGFAGVGHQNTQVIGGGLSVSGSWGSSRRAVALFQMVAGRGLSHYVKDTSTLDLELALDDRGQVRAVPLVAGVVGVQRTWSDRVRSTLTASFVRVDRMASMTGDTYRGSRYLSGNILFTEAPFVFGIEYDAGRLEVQDGRHNWNGRVQVAAQFDLFK